MDSEQDAYKLLSAGSALIVLGTLALCRKADFLSDSDRPHRERTEPLHA